MKMQEKMPQIIGQQVCLLYLRFFINTSLFSKLIITSTDKFDSIAFILGQESVPTKGKETGLGKESNKMREQENSENGSRNTADNNVGQEKGRPGSSLTNLESAIDNEQGEGSKQATRKPDSEETNQMTNGKTDTHSTTPKTNQGNTDENTVSTKPNENSLGQSTQTKPNQNVEKITNTPVITDTAPQEPKIHPGREDNQIPKPGDQYKPEEGNESPGKGESSGKAIPSAGERSPVGEGSPVIEAPLQASVHKIAPETRLPGEFTSPSSEGNNLILKTKQNAIKRPFSKLLDAHQRDEIRHLVRAKN